MSVKDLGKIVQHKPREDTTCLSFVNLGEILQCEPKLTKLPSFVEGPLEETQVGQAS